MKHALTIAWALAASCNVTWTVLSDDALGKPLAAVGGEGVIYAPARPRTVWLPGERAAASPEGLTEFYAPICVQGRGQHDKRTKYPWSPDVDSIGRANLERTPKGRIGTNDAGHPRRDDEILLHFDQSHWRDPENYQRFLRLPPGAL